MSTPVRVDPPDPDLTAWLTASQTRLSVTGPPAPAPPGPIEWRDGLPGLAIGGLLLREPVTSDATSLFEHLATDQVARFMSKPPARPQGFERFISWIQSERHAGRCFCYAIQPEGLDRAVGLIQVRQLEPGFGTAEWGFALGQRFWGTGLFVKGARAVIDFVFRHVGAYRLEARASTENDRGNGALRKLGANIESVLRQSLLGAERPADQYLWSLAGDDWLARTATPPYVLLPVQENVPAPAAAAMPAPPPSVAPWRQRLPMLTAPGGTLRDLDRSDAPELLRQLNHPDVERYILPGPSSVESFEQFIAWAQRQRDKGRYACFAAIPAGASAPVGIFQLRQLDPSFKTAEWGFVLGAAHWGSGIFLTGASLLLDFAFDTVGVHRLEARAAIGNGRGNGALRKVGCTLEGHLRRSFLLGGVYHDDSLWGLLADDWRRVRGNLPVR